MAFSMVSKNTVLMYLWLVHLLGEDVSSRDTSASWPSSSGLTGHRRTYLTILESSDHVLFKMVRYTSSREVDEQAISTCILSIFGGSRHPEYLNIYGVQFISRQHICHSRHCLGKKFAKCGQLLDPQLGGGRLVGGRPGNATWGSI
jgi:hypothetical protein